ncbi:MAG: bifunctional folylpolyglutamate synthase/dihydrofolate synthase [Kiritimatiellales bacterium]|nr:bifunctional folylpolyglutamate synthase/dihydrofolate synthase [Kiritimatiellales bacterium]
MSELKKAVADLFARTAHGIKPGLDVIHALLQALDNPHHKLAVIHVAGTNGKGSVCAMIESVLRASGFKTGLYTSPHLVNFSERFRINGVPMPGTKLEEYIQRLEKTARYVEEVTSNRPATFFEMSTAIAFRYFADEEVDFAIIETGMGGRWDATNMVIPLVSVITSIDIDHTVYLGESIEQIAGEKAGIIKSGRPVVSAPQSGSVMAVLKNEGVPIIGSSDAVSVQCLEKSPAGQKLKIETQSRSLPPINLPLLGECQRENCAVAIAALEVVADMTDFEPEFKRGLESVEWGVRFQILDKEPVVILDGAHNPSAANALAKTLKEYYPGYDTGFILGFLEDKDIHGCIHSLGPVVAKIWTIPINAQRGLSAEDAAAQVKAAGLYAEAGTVSNVWKSAREWAEFGDKRLVCITGSLYIKQMLVEAGLFSG